MVKKISLLGATGSIGTQTVDIVLADPGRFEITALAAGRNLPKLREILARIKPQFVAVSDEADAEKLRAEFPGIRFGSGREGLLEASAGTEADIVVGAVIGSVGLEPTLEAIRSGRDIAIANKETLVAAGSIVTSEAEKHGVRLLPVDSEHSALFQALNGEDPKRVDRLILTASGGSFRDKSRDELEGVTVAEALAHPNWSMGSKLTIDSATMMNKGLEVIEAHHLFGMPYDRIDVLLHRESIIHSMVEFEDTSVIAQLGSPDMRVPIQYALTYPDRLPRKGTERLDLAKIGLLHFEEVDLDRFPALRIAFESGRAGGTATTVMNAANEVAVALFMEGRITFTEIEPLVEQALGRHDLIAEPDLETVLAVDAETRKAVLDMVK
ncbi:1-deoxy-D-xylulose 5-phosphate reductoisomerase [Bhargavaea cecembensis DSE10]|uniref:1-deoxy-D-xylulose 5-phosphate reductoisomerase n=1 Tax=Bhargavaea cecembensis DSE10 TaxID=1235279 RepID=M7P0S5_9BACL|nr:1-deoxy-D-xylulose-5-phosphate reductoisomerase [Bhargavaea cecembensis]EMR07520.1 1-deoxy-D-xylulose 5-phosphate reductoisomerase [Bhargavaea cecembensis DSE10]